MLAPGRKILDISFILVNALFYLPLFLSPNVAQYDSLLVPYLLLVGIGFISIFVYVFEVRSYMRKIGRSGAFWLIIAFFLGPIGVWLSFIASFLKTEDAA